MKLEVLQLQIPPTCLSFRLNMDFPQIVLSIPVKDLLFLSVDHHYQVSRHSPELFSVTFYLQPLLLQG